MSTGNPAAPVVTDATPTPLAAPKPKPKGSKTVVHIHDQRPAAEGGASKKEGAGFIAGALGVLGGLAIGALLAAGVVLAFKHRDKVKAAFFPARREDEPAAS